MLNRKEIADVLSKVGLSQKNLTKLKGLSSRVLNEIAQSMVMYKQADLQKKMEDAKNAFDARMKDIQAAQSALQSQQKSGGGEVAEVEDVESDESYSSENDGTVTLDTDKVGNPNVDIKKGNGKGKKQKLITDKDSKEEITSEMVENWMTQVVNKQNKKLTKSKLVEMIKNSKNEGRMDTPGGNPDYFYDDDSIISQMNRQEKQKEKRTKLFASIEQEYAFEQLNKYVLDLDGYEIMVDELETGEDPEESVLNLFLASNSGMVWDISIYTDGNIYMDDAPIQDSQDLEEEIREKESGGENYQEELDETERDTEGAYMGAPVGTEMPSPTPVITPTTTPTRPGRKRGPFTRPKTTPKPKAGKDEMPDWMGFDDITSQIENS